MKKMSLDETWKNCKDMWQWIAEQIENGSDKGIGTLKHEWLNDNGYEGYLKYDCFFCTYAGKGRDRSISFNELCSACPARKVDEEFKCEGESEYSWHRHPVEFYKKIKSLDQKRIEGSLYE